MQRAKGKAVAEFHVCAGRTRLKRLHQSGCLKLRFPRVFTGSAEVVAINSSGGLAGGDRLSQRFSAGEGAALSVTTQACERVYRSSGGEARWATTLDVGTNASLAYLPQETILFDGGALSRTLTLDCSASSRVLLVESLVLGRTAMGETVGTGHFRDSWRIRRDGRLVHADELRLSGSIGALAASGPSLDGAKAFATVFLHDAEAGDRLGEARALIGDAGGASAFEGMLVARLVAANGFALRKRLIPVLSLLAKAPLPRVWSL